MEIDHKPVKNRVSAGSVCPPLDLWKATSLSRFRPNSSDAALLSNAGSRRTVSRWSRNSTYHRDAVFVCPFRSL